MRGEGKGMHGEGKVVCGLEQSCCLQAFELKYWQHGGKMRKECMLPVSPGSIAGDRWQPQFCLWSIVSEQMR